MRERLIEFLNYYGEPVGVDYQKFANYLLENGVVALPCRIDDTVYVIPTKENGRTEIAELRCLGFLIGKPCNTANCFDDKNKLFQPSFEEFGKTVFLPREEAEAALERSKQ